MHANRPLVYLVAAITLILCAGCGGWSTGTPFTGDYADFDPGAYNPVDNEDPMATVAGWFSSMEFIRSENEDGAMVPDKELGRDFDLWLSVVNPVVLQDPSGQFIGMEQVDALRELWNSTDWEVEFLDLKMELGFQEGGEARVDLVGGGVRYIGDEFFDSPEYRQDSFGDKKGEVFLRFYDDTANDPLQYIAGFEDIAGKGRWVVIGGLDLSEEEPWGEEIGLR
ncbi:MAG: hypothetical protein PHP28_12140 [Actinomycetota bacterium]|nr:hypothetical protein [Actinomycetota bacterium]MDD5666295.1 hypothetical protein [Actinomycetota bacterium]